MTSKQTRITVLALTVGVALGPALVQSPTEATPSAESSRSAPVPPPRAVNGYWDWPQGAPQRGYRQQIRITRKSSGTYWASYWFGAADTAGGYMGIQTNGIRANGNIGDLVIFSLWGSDRARGKGCIPFVEDGTGFSCRKAVAKVRTKGYYTFRLKRLRKRASGTWWQASYHHPKESKRWRQIGRLHTPPTWSMGGYGSSFVEHFAAAHECGAWPPASGIFLVPQALGTKQGATLGQAAPDPCINGTATPTPMKRQPAWRLSIG